MSRTFVEEIAAEKNYVMLTEENFEPILAQAASAVVYLSGDPKKYPEANDVIVVLPELVRTFEEAFEVMVANESVEQKLATRYGINQWPAMVFIKSGEYVDVITRMRDWEDYLRDIPKILQQTPKRAPSVGIPVVVQ